MLVCAMVAAMGLNVLAADQAPAAGADKAPAKAHKQMTDAERETMMNKRLDAIKAKDEALYKELVALKEKDPAAFKAKMRELGKAAHAKGEGKGKKAKGADAAK
jgi:hypothetical protein